MSRKKKVSRRNEEALRAAAILELARANHHLARTKRRSQPAMIAIDPRRSLLTTSKFEIDEALRLNRSTAPAIMRARKALAQFVKTGAISEFQAESAINHLLGHINERSRTEVKGMSHDTDLPPELAAYSDGVSDDAAFHPEIIGCGTNCSGSIGAELLVGAHHGIPGYLFTRKGLRNADVRLRIASHIKAMTPKLRRRVLGRLREAVFAARVLNRPRISGEVRNAYASIAGWGAVSGHSEPSVAIGRCPYANVAGALTP